MTLACPWQLGSRAAVPPTPFQKQPKQLKCTSFNTQTVKSWLFFFPDTEQPLFLQTLTEGTDWGFIFIKISVASLKHMFSFSSLLYTAIPTYS